MGNSKQQKRQPMNDRQIGWRKYVLGDAITECDNEEQRRGWTDANKAEGWALTSEVYA